MKINIAKISLIVYAVVLVLSGFLMCAPGGRVPVFCIMAAFSVPPIISRKKMYRILGIVALVFAVSAASIDYQAGRRNAIEMNETLKDHKEHTSQIN